MFVLFSSLQVHNVGEGKVSVLDHGEDYVLTFPSAYGNSIMTTPWVELGGACKITCPQSGYSANIEFKRKPFWGAEYNKVTAEIMPPGGKKNIVKVNIQFFQKVYQIIDCFIRLTENGTEE